MGRSRACGGALDDSTQSLPHFPPFFHTFLPPMLPHPQGSWNLRNASFHEGKRLDVWAVASLMRKEEAETGNPLSEFLRALYSMLRACGIQV